MATNEEMLVSNITDLLFCKRWKYFYESLVIHFCTPNVYGAIFYILFIMFPGLLPVFIIKINKMNHP